MLAWFSLSGSDGSGEQNGGVGSGSTTLQRKRRGGWRGGGGATTKTKSCIEYQNKRDD